MDVIYKNETGRNYLIITGKDENLKRSYRYKMILKNDIADIVNVHTECVDNISYYYYDISSMQSLVELFKGRKIRYEDTKKIVNGIKRIHKIAEEYLLYLNEIVFLPEYIYVNPQTMEPCFCYYPENEVKTREGIEQLSKFFLEVVEHNDQKSVEYVYELYCKAIKDNFAIEDWFETELKRDKISELMDVAVEEMENMNNDEDVDKQNKKAEQMNNDIVSKIKLFIAKLFNVDIKTSPTQQTEYKDEPNEEIKIESDELEDDGEETILLNVDYSNVHSLVQKEDGIAFEISSYPFFIGTLKSRNDLCPVSDKVSRVHARVSMEAGDTVIEDMNSRNGSYVNGCRLQPYEKKMIRENDIIRLADVEYIFI